MLLLTLCFLCGSAAGVLASQSDCALPNPCVVEGEHGGTYFMALPAKLSRKSGRVKPFVFFHGHNGSAKGVMRSARMIKRLNALGFAVIAPDGPLFTFRGRTAQGWAARPEKGVPRGGRDDIKFVERVLRDAARRARLDLNKTVVSGFSSGGSMAWFFACYSNAPLGGVVAIAGGLRRPLPRKGVPQADGSLARTCPGGPRRMVHIHGYSDRQVPLEGRGIRAWHQGDVFEGLAVQRHTNGCRSRPSRIETKGRFWCRSWSGCKSGKSVHFCLHPGGHGMPTGWLKEGVNLLSKPRN